MASDLIGKGVFATVRLENSADGSSVAVKVYEHRVGSPGSDLQRMHEMHLANEVRLAGRLAHPHIIAPQEVRVGGSQEPSAAEATVPIVNVSGRLFPVETVSTQPHQTLKSSSLIGSAYRCCRGYSQVWIEEVYELLRSQADDPPSALEDGGYTK